jgi:glucokinase
VFSGRGLTTIANQDVRAYKLTNASAPPSLVADVGGTNARFSLFSEASGITSVRVLPCERYPGLSDAVRDYLNQVGDPDLNDAVIAIATPVLGDQVQMTNHHWSFSVAATRRALGLRTLLVINDFSALAMSLPFLGEKDLRLLDRHGEVRHGVKAVIGPGTGLGVAGLVPVGSDWEPLASEGGHAAFAPADPLEMEVLRLLWSDFPHVSVERLLSGRGISLLYRTLCKIHGSQPATDDSARIVELAEAGGSETAQETLRMFSGMLGGVAGNVALTFGCTGGLYLGGGVLGKLADAFDVALFRERFVAKGRFAGYLEAIPKLLITAEQPALIGAAQQLKKYLAHRA